MRSNFIKQHSGNCYGSNYQNAACSLKNKFIVSFIIIFGTFSLAVTLRPNIESFNETRVCVTAESPYGTKVCRKL